MNWKVFSLGSIWLFFSFLIITLLSTQDKEWWIGTGEIKNICDLMSSVENDDVRDIGVLFSLPVFFPAIYALVKRKRHWFIHLVTVSIAAYWLWQFFIRYQLCLS